jgi:inner membrane protein
MNPITHILTGWCVAEAFPRLTMRQRAVVTIAAVAPDVDGLGILADLATRHSRRPLLWWTEYHHVLGHNLLFALITAFAAAALARGNRAITATVALVAVHLHILGDLAGSRGPDDYQWPIPYLYPFAAEPQLTWSGQWYLNAWPNVAITIALMILTGYLASRRGYSVIGLLSRRADAAFVAALRNRFGQPQ